MKLLIKYELFIDSPTNEERDGEETVELVRNLAWKDELSASEETTHFPSLEIINEKEKRMLIITALDQKEEILFTVESLRAGKLARGKTGTLINELPHADVVGIVEAFCRQDYSTIEKMDNSGFISKLLRKVIFLFADDGWEKDNQKPTCQSSQCR